MTIENLITLFDWDNTLSADGVMNLGYNDDVILMNIIFAMIKIDL